MLNIEKPEVNIFHIDEDYQGSAYFKLPIQRSKKINKKT